MELLLCVFVFVVGALALCAFIKFFRRSRARHGHPNLNVPEIPAQLPSAEDSPKIFVDPLIMQLHGMHTETVFLVSRSGIEINVLVNRSAAAIYRENGPTPFREAIRAWSDSSAYCYCGSRFSGSEDELGEMALAYLYGVLLGEEQFDRAFVELELYWHENREKCGHKQL